MGTTGKSGVRHARALNAEAERVVVLRAFCFELPAGTADKPAPEWIPYLPAPDATGRLVGADGRAWSVKDLRALCAGVKRKLPLDINHSTDLLGKAGHEAPAVGWLTGFEVRADGSTWAKVDWNQRGLNALQGKDYGFISPFFDYDSNGVITRLAGASLVNEPNFTSLALNARQSNEDDTMKEILLALGLAETASATDAVGAIAKLKDDGQRALNSASQPDIKRFVPRADYDAMETRATNAEKKLQESDKAAHQKAVDEEIAGALKEGKITPATEKYYRGTCATAEGLASFRDFRKSAVAVVDDKLTGDRRPRHEQAGDAKSISDRALNFQKTQRELGREVSIADAVTHVVEHSAQRQ
ncbi:MAG TPA: phage protease [Nevskiaceae bacterium]|nr:phage protease [Nevskiaceae bacterium]